MNVKMLLCAAAAVMGSVMFAQDNGKVVFKEDFEKAKVNSQGKLTIPAWYSPIKLKEGHEVTVTREKLNVHSGTFACKYVNLNEKVSIYMLHETGVIDLKDSANKTLQLSVSLKGTGSIVIAFVFYKNGKFLRSAGVSAVPGKQALPSTKKPFDDADWTTCYGQIAKIPADATNCKVAIFVSPKSELFLDDLEIKLVDKK
ncbi:MAG: hypothetical protein IJW23_02490 [Lentisphaeria bacterium]|nr:hypothetical protein [Lentisphaeria bacterium]